MTPRRWMCVAGMLCCLAGSSVRPCSAQTIRGGVSTLSATLDAASVSISTQTRRSPLVRDKRFSLQFPITRRQSISFGTGYIRFTSVPEDLLADDAAVSIKPAWRFKAVPITLSYAYTLTDPARRWVPVVRAGVAYYMSSMKRALADGNLPTDRMAPIRAHEAIAPVGRASFTEKLGLGYGVHASIGIRANVDRSMYVLAEQRICYVQGLAFTPNHNLGIDANFLRLDFNLGLGFRF